MIPVAVIIAMPAVIVRPIIIAIVRIRSVVIAVGVIPIIAWKADPYSD
jgi:hypothetical protein